MKGSVKGGSMRKSPIVFVNLKIVVFILLSLVVVSSVYAYSCLLCPGSGNQCWVCGEPPVCPATPDINIVEPLEDNTYNTGPLHFETSISDNVSRITLVLTGATSYSTVLCNDCDSYSGFTESLKRGSYQLCIKILTYPLGPCQGDVYTGFSKTSCKHFYVTDETLPKINGFSPEDSSSIAYGSFSVYYNSSIYNSTDDFNISLLIKNGASYDIFTKQDCALGENASCNFDVDLKQYNSSEIKFYFRIDDYRGFSVRTREATVYFDEQALNIEVISPTDAFYDSWVPFNITMNETVDSLDYSVDDANFSNLCVNCDSYIGSLNFSDGSHSVVLRALKGSNYYHKSLDFTVDSQAPVILQVFPSNNSVFYDANFSVYFSEEHPIAVVFYWRVVGVDDEFLGKVFDCDLSSGYCSGVVDLSYLNYYDDSAPIEYYFKVFDYLRNSSSQVHTSTFNLNS